MKTVRLYKWPETYNCMDCYFRDLNPSFCSREECKGYIYKRTELKRPGKISEYIDIEAD